MTSSRNRWVFATAGGFLVFTAVIVLRLLPPTALRAFDDFGLVAFAVLATAAAASASQRLTGASRRAWRFLALGSGLWSAGQLQWSLAQNVLDHDTPFPSVADAFFLLGYAATAIGIASFPSVVRLGRVRSFIDGGIVACSGAFVAWNLLLPAVATVDDETYLVAALAYPVADVLLGVVLAAALTRTRWRSPDLLLIAAAVVIRIATNGAYALLLVGNAYETGSRIDPGWSLWLALTVVAAVHARDHEDHRARSVPSTRTWVPYVPLAVALAVRVWMQVTDRPVTMHSLVLLLAAVFLVIARQAMMLAENSALHRAVTRRFDELSELTRERETALSLLDAVLAQLPGGAYRYALAEPEAGRLAFASAGFAELSGYTPDELVAGMSARDLMHPADREMVTAAIHCAHARGVHFDVVHRIVRKDGETRWVADKGRLVDDGGTLVINGFVADVTDEIQLAKQAEHDRRIEAVGRLAAGVAHDVNNIVTALGCHADLLRRGIDDGRPLLAHLDGIDDASNRVRALARQLLSIARNEAGEHELVDLSEIVLDLEPLLRSLARDGVSLTVLVDEVPAALVDRCRFEQAVLNLALNAFEACRDEGRVRISVTHRERSSEILPFVHAGRGGDRGYIVVEVSDDGVGMDAATREKCFDPFFTTKGGLGTGLGLATASAVVNDSNGHLAVESAPGAGTCFRAFVPAAGGSVRVHDNRIVGPRVEHEERVLVVDDDEAVLAAAEQMLTAAGFSVTATSSPASALAAASSRDERFGVVLADVRMPEMDGLELVARLGESDPALKTLFMTGTPDPRLARDEVLAKPFTSEELLAAVRSTLS